MNIDTSKYTLEEKDGQLIFTPIKSKMVKSWEDLGIIRGWYMGGDSVAITAEGKSYSTRQNVWATKEQAEASLAMSQLSQLMKQANGDWVADLNDCDNKWCLRFYKYAVNKFSTNHEQAFLTFKEEKVRDEFLEKHKVLIEQARPLL